MEEKIIAGVILPPLEGDQLHLHRMVEAFTEEIRRTQNAADIQKDVRQSVPASGLPMVF